MEAEAQQNTGQNNFKEGELLNFIRVRFPGHTKALPFYLGKRKFQYGQTVLAMSDRGMAVGYINSFPYQVPFKEDLLPLKKISKVASAEDIEAEKERYYEIKRAESLCKDLVEKLKLDMEITHVEFTQFGKKAVFYFNAPHRIDFRQLVKDLVQDLRMRIELRQISLRDRSAAIGGIGPCGQQLCCSSFLNRYGKVHIKMAKNQNLTMSSNRLNGVCGQIKCCVEYEDEVYSHKRKSLPKQGSFIECANGDRGKVLRLHVLVSQFDLITDQGQIRRYDGGQFDPERELPEKWSFPMDFRSILNETSKVIGQTAPSLEMAP